MSLSGNVSELTPVAPAMLPSWPLVFESRLRSMPGLPVLLKVAPTTAVVPAITWRSSAQRTWVAMLLVPLEILVWPLLGMRQSWRCS